MKRLTLIIVITVGCMSCTDINSSSLLDSDAFKTTEERVAQLKKEIKSNSDFYNAEFELFNVNGFSKRRPTSIPGASSWDYKFAIRVTPSNVDKWTEGMQKIDFTDYNLNWTEKIIEARAKDWKTTSTPEFYTNKSANTMLIVYRTEGIIYKRVIAN